MLRRIAGTAVAGVTIAGLTIPGMFLPHYPTPLSIHEKLACYVPKHTSRVVQGMRWETLQGRERRVSMDAYVPLGKEAEGCPVVFVAPPSFVSSRTSWLPLVKELRKHTDRPLILLELPAYGDNSTREARELEAEEISPCEYRNFLNQLLSNLRDEHGGSPAVVAAGHAAPLVLEVAWNNPSLVECVCALNPTWRGPLPTVEYDTSNSFLATCMSLLRKMLWQLHSVPLIGNSLHVLGTQEANIRQQLHSHVFVDPSFVTQSVVDRNLAFAREGNISGKWAFLSGVVDSFATREEFGTRLDAALAAGGKAVPTLVVIGRHVPKTSSNDLKPLNGRSNVQVLTSSGALRSFVEFPEEISATLVPFLANAAKT